MTVRLLPFKMFLGILSLILVLLQVSAKTERPIIGILSHEDHKPPKSYIPASYVKAVEQSGARVVPLFLSRNEAYYKKMVDSVNGMIFIGGDADTRTVGGYFEAARYIFHYTRELHAKGDNFPLLGVCLGLGALAVFTNNDTYTNTVEACPGVNGALLPLIFTNNFRNSSLFRNIPQNLVDILQNQNIAPHYHHYCLRPDKKLKLPWHILSLNKDSDGKEFVSSMELEGPIVGIQFHPEKNPYEWQLKNPSFEDALLSARHFYDWLVIEARKNNHSFPNSKEENAALIYNYSPEYSGPKGSIFTQKYIFNAPSAAGSFEPSKFLTILCSVILLILVTNKLYYMNI